MDVDDRLVLTPTQVEQDDVKAEAVLRELETGKKQSLRIIFNELASSDRTLYFGTYHKTLDQAQLPWADDNRCSINVINRLVDWTLRQEPRTRVVVFSFLEAEDKESMLPSVFKELGLVGNTAVDVSPKGKGNKKMSMSSMMMKSLPATKEELIVMIQRVSPETKRPAATVRQWIREKTRSNKIFLGNDERYHQV
jgi:hypothetical protein